MYGDQRNHLTLAHEAFYKRTGYMPRGGWLIWVDLYAEAKRYNMPKAVARLEAILGSSTSIDGWGQMRLVEAMRGEVKPDTPSAGSWLGAAPTTLVNVMQPQGQAGQNGHLEERKKRGLIARLRGP
jgi:hypothetical protein